MEESDPDFQKVINRLENKGSDEQSILILNFMRRLRKASGTNLAQHLSLYNGEVYDSSHFVSALTIINTISDCKMRKKMREKHVQLRNRKREKLKPQRFFSEDQINKKILANIAENLLKIRRVNQISLENDEIVDDDYVE